MAVTKASPLKTASSSGALCVVVETPLEATTHDEPKLKKDTPAINIPNAETTGDATERKDFTNPEEEAPKQAIRRTTTDAFKGIQKLQGKRIKEWRKLFSLQVYLTPFHERDTFKPTEGTFSIHGRKVHGICRLPKGYGFQMLPIGTAVYERGQEEEDAKEDGNFVKRSTKRIIAALKCMKSRKRTDEEKAEEKTEKRECSINSSYSFAKASVAIFQTVYASFTLYRTRGDQLNRYGYAAFGLTVAPYVVMSVMNLVCAVLTPDYDHVYMIESPVMKQARDAGGTFVGMVGSLKIRGAASETSSVYRPSASGRASPVAAPLTNGVSSIPSSTHAPDEPSAVKMLPTTATAAEEGIAPAAAAHTPKLSLDLDVPGPNQSLHVLSKGIALQRSITPVTPITGAPLDSQEAEKIAKKHKIWQAIGLFFASILVGCFAIAIIGGISGFKKGHSTEGQRIWTMAWFSFGATVGPIPLLRILSDVRHGTRYYWIVDIILLVFCAPAVGDYIVVGQQLYDYERCIRIY